jgi:hypothetical protein
MAWMLRITDRATGTRQITSRGTMRGMRSER